jgi:hypothetical protein
MLTALGVTGTPCRACHERPRIGPRCGLLRTVISGTAQRPVETILVRACYVGTAVIVIPKS